MTFNITCPKNVTNLFGNWLNGIDKAVKVQIRVGVCALPWAIWHVRNDFVFNKTANPSFMQAITLTTHWIRMCSFLQPEERKQDMASGCNRLETVARDLFNRCGWRFDKRIEC
jgi:hypothetical protein